MRAGELKDRVTIESKSVALDSVYGTEVITWVAVASRVAASVEEMPPSRNEAMKNNLAGASNRATVRMRYRSDIDSSMRVVVHYETDRILQIVGGPTRIDGSQRGIEMLCEDFTS